MIDASQKTRQHFHLIDRLHHYSFQVFVLPYFLLFSVNTFNCVGRCDFRLDNYCERKTVLQTAFAVLVCGIFKALDDSHLRHLVCLLKFKCNACKWIHFLSCLFVCKKLLVCLVCCCKMAFIFWLAAATWWLKWHWTGVNYGKSKL